MKKLGILQSNYIPWKGYFDLIAQVDEFIIYDEITGAVYCSFEKQRHSCGIPLFEFA